MKRSELRRKSPLKASRPRLRLVNEPGEEAWKIPRAGYCQCGCDRFAMHLQRHHVVRESDVRRAGGNPWDQANSMLLAPACHANHHAAFRKILLERVPDVALAFAVDLLGLDAASDYFYLRYDARLTNSACSSRIIGVVKRGRDADTSDPMAPGAKIPMHGEDIEGQGIA